MLLTTFLVVLSACTVATAGTRTLAPGEPDVELPDPRTLPQPPDAGR